MTIDRDADERSALAAELALGLLEGADLTEARALAAGDAGFRAEVQQWTARFAPLLDSIAEKAPSEAVWKSVSTMIAPHLAAANDDQPELRRSLTRWRMASGALGATAAALALLLVVPRPSGPSDPTPAPQVAAAKPMVAIIAGEEAGPVRLVANWDPAGRQLIVTPAMKPPTDVNKAMELWVIPSGGRPHSMGVMPAQGPMRGTIDLPMAAMLNAGATLAITIERPGGSPTGAPLGPVIATGQMIGV